MKNLINLFFDLVKIDSPSGKEEAMSIYLQKWLKKNLFNYKIDKVGNLYATNNKSGVPLLICAHMDTVQPGENIKPVIKKGVIKSDGKTILGADNKAALATIMAAVEENGDRNLELLFTVKEETGGGVEHLPFEWIKSKHALVFDSSKPLGGIVMRSPFIYNFDVQFKGKSTHASTPEMGINAFTPAFQALSSLPVGTLDNEETTINIGLIKGGTGINTVPDSIHIQGEVRSYDKILFETHLKTIKKTVKKYAKKYKTDATFTLNGYCAGYSHTKNTAFIKQIDAMYKNIGLKTMFYKYSGISDTNVLMEHGIETVNLTDGTKYSHTTNEEIAINDLIKLGEIVKKCIAEL